MQQLPSYLVSLIRALARPPHRPLQCVNYVHSLKLVSHGDLERLSFHNPLKFIGMSAADLEDVEQVLWVDEKGAFAIAGCRPAN